MAAALDAVLDLDFESLTTPERLALLERCETVRRRLPAVEHPLINALAADADATELGGKLSWALVPPPHLDHGQPRTNQFHHPEILLLRRNSGASEAREDGEDGDEDENNQDKAP